MSEWNMPEDVRMYDHDPRSPFYNGFEIECNVCGEEMEEVDIKVYKCECGVVLDLTLEDDGR